MEFNRLDYLKILSRVKELGLKTICLEGNCPNRYYCFAKKTVTFLLLGDICTRDCHYCNVKQGIPNDNYNNDINYILLAIEELKLKYVVLTQVTRDDLEDGGASYIAGIITQIKSRYPEIKIEVLISDLNGNKEALLKILDAKPDVLNHNIEVVKSLFPKLRPKGDYNRSLELLNLVANYEKGIKIKTGLMVGLGETIAEILLTFKDLKKSGVDILTIGQYLQPNIKKHKVMKHYTKDEFKLLKDKALEIGFEKVVSGSNVRSSYRAKECLND